MAEALSPTLSNDGFAARLRELGAPQTFAIAVSGGGDSMALALLCADYKAGTGAEVLAFTVDHGLRPEAADEARRAGDWCRRLGLPHQTLHWKGGKPQTGLQAAARETRYALLIDAAERAGAQALLTAHTADDQAETLFMRLARGSGARALRAMPDRLLVAAGASDPMPLLRPLLCAPRMDLVALLRDAGQDFVHDPSNDDPAFERVRVRALLGALDENRLLSPAALARSATRLRLESDQLRAADEALFSALGGLFYGWGGVGLDRLGDDDAASAALLRRLFHAVGGGDYAPDPTAVQTAIAAAEATDAATLGGALVRRWRGRWLMLREPAALNGRAGVAPMQPIEIGETPILWDRRFILANRSQIAGCTVAPCAGAEIAGFSAELLPDAALAASPGIYREAGLIGAPAFPSLGDGGVNALCLVRERFYGEVVRFSVQLAENSGEPDGAGLS